ncbi:hypothetical protein JG688_00006205 [Phytophthora aleatoria]|uniref:Uncharacterized protein n=1 Tax=Phytophthora aleatoria TaxID=2496075 RepID=A0A8J5MGS2_9STRA|nr:hypothetical protein JG688_00006205 [Phytophthora aleatoria]
MPELANLRVGTVEELENAIATVFEKALANEEFCDVMAKIISLDNLYYSSLLGTPPHKIAGPFNIKTPPCNDLVLTKTRSLARPDAELFVFPRRRVACGMGRRAAAQVLRVQADRAQWAIQQPQSGTSFGDGDWVGIGHGTVGARETAQRGFMPLS